MHDNELGIYFIAGFLICSAIVGGQWLSREEQDPARSLLLIAAARAWTHYPG